LQSKTDFDSDYDSDFDFDLDAESCVVQTGAEYHGKAVTEQRREILLKQPSAEIN
jgi:hypothetical protein